MLPVRRWSSGWGWMSPGGGRWSWCNNVVLAVVREFRCASWPCGAETTSRIAKASEAQRRVEGLVDKEQQPCLLLSRGPGQGSLVAVERSGITGPRQTILHPARSYRGSRPSPLFVGIGSLCRLVVPPNSITLTTMIALSGTLERACRREKYKFCDSPGASISSLRIASASFGQ